MSERRILWTVTDPRGLSISLAEDVWQEHASRHAEIEPYFEQAKLTVQDPDEIYFDPDSTAETRAGNTVYHYIRRSFVLGRRRPRPLVTVVKVVIEQDNIARGYVSSILFPGHMKKGLILEWKK